jgi:hypothetical protein
MSNLEFIFNPSVRPVYITATNMVLPIINISPMGFPVPWDIWPGALLYSIKNIILNILIKILDICYLFITIIGLLIIISRTLAIIYKLYKIR